MSKFKIALIQMRSGIDPAENIEVAIKLIREAADKGARFVATPEVTHLMQKDAELAFEVMCSPENDPAIPAFSNLAKSLDITLLIGSLALRQGDKRAANRSFLFGPTGQIMAQYDKIHMFDVGLGPGEHYRESDNYKPGETLVVVDTEMAKLGLSICYDVRFGYLYRKLAQAGAQIITVPAAFTKLTGRAHWEILLRARAIETGSYILAPAQGGLHEDGRKTWGHSIVIGPWGEIVAELDHDEPGLLFAELDLKKVEDARRRIPALSHDRAMSDPVIGI